MTVRGSMGTPLVLIYFLLPSLSCNQQPTAPAATPNMIVRGLTVANWTPEGYASATAHIALQDLILLGANQTTFVMTAYQPDVHASRVANDTGRTPSIASVRTAIQGAHALGLQVALKPHVDVDDGAWRGRIEPADPQRWFASYRAFLEPWIALAIDEEVEQFVIGTELAGLSSDSGIWRRLISETRTRFGGTLSYAASWDEASRIGFWESLDFVGVNAYFPVTLRRDAGRAEMLVGWQAWLDRLEQLHNKANRKILLTEIGYRSVDGAGMHPYEFGNTGEWDPVEQADLYWAAMTATGNLSWIEGLVWWNYLASGQGGEFNLDFTPAGKLAALEVLAAWGP